MRTARPKVSWGSVHAAFFGAWFLDSTCMRGINRALEKTMANWMGRIALFRFPRRRRLAPPRDSTLATSSPKADAHRDPTLGSSPTTPTLYGTRNHEKRSGFFF